MKISSYAGWKSPICTQRKTKWMTNKYIREILRLMVKSIENVSLGNSFTILSWILSITHRMVTQWIWNCSQTRVHWWVCVIHNIGCALLNAQCYGVHKVLNKNTLWDIWQNNNMIPNQWCHIFELYFFFACYTHQQNNIYRLFNRIE